ncbi:unnamed protein product [Cuscuta europaea]|uniref:Uncharacterized protein n=1 Tax=Cuscuta europaea TaxID=41803 RepID=A0A9P1EIW4_CUSEU|nr:unnamed protein product [Cuscuta europaea]
MGLSWKKAKRTAIICQMLKDQFNQRKNAAAASPLVVETGFPTSLVDLIVNHRDRFKKPSPSARFNNKSSPPQPSAGDPILLPLPPSLAPPSPSETPIATSGTRENEGLAIGGQDGEANSNKVLSGVLSMFLLVGLALGAKKFAVGITLSAFLLVILDYLARNMFQYEIPAIFTKSRENLRLMMIVAHRFIISRRASKLEEEVAVLDDGDDGMNDPTDEIHEIVEDEANKDPSLDDRCAMGDLIEEDHGEGPQPKRGKSRRAKIRSKMKKLFPSKKTARKDSKLEKKNVTGEVKPPPTRRKETELECDDEEAKDAPFSPQGVETRESSGYLLLILVMVALAGVVMGGRIYALFFTLTCCFLSKPIEARATRRGLIKAKKIS